MEKLNKCSHGINLNPMPELLAHESKLIKVGLEIAKILNLKMIKRGDQKGRYKTAWGAKTPEGLTRTVMRVLSEHGLDF